MRAYASVLLPEPFGPMTACTSFVSTSRSTPLTISVPSSSATCRFSNFSSATRYASFPQNSGAFAPPGTTETSLARPPLLPPDRGETRYSRRTHGVLPDSLAHCPASLDRAAPLRRQAAAGDRQVARTRDARVQGRRNGQLLGRRRRAAGASARRADGDDGNGDDGNAGRARDRLARTWRGLRAVSATPMRQHPPCTPRTPAAGSSSCSAQSPSRRSSPTSSTRIFSTG